MTPAEALADGWSYAERPVDALDHESGIARRFELRKRAMDGRHDIRMVVQEARSGALRCSCGLPDCPHVHVVERPVGSRRRLPQPSAVTLWPWYPRG